MVPCLAAPSAVPRLRSGPLRCTGSQFAQFLPLYTQRVVRHLSPYVAGQQWYESSCTVSSCNCDANSLNVFAIHEKKTYLSGICGRKPLKALKRHLGHVCWTNFNG